MSNSYFVICAHNEEGTLESVTADLLERTDSPIVIVDNASTDATPRIIKRLQQSPRVYGVVEPTPGKALALRAGFKYALANGAANIATMDGDGEHRPEQMVGLMEAHVLGDYPVTIGTRFGSVDEMAEKDRIIAKAIERLTGTFPIDPRCGGRAYTVSVLAQLLPECLSRTYGLEAELCYLSLDAGEAVQFYSLDNIYIRDRIQLEAAPPGLEDCSSSELIDLYRVFGRGDLQAGKKLLAAHDLLNEAFTTGTSFFGDVEAAGDNYVKRGSVTAPSA